MCNKMTAKNRLSAEVIQFEHYDPILAMSYIKAKHEGLTDVWANKTEQEKRSYVESDIVRGKFFWSMDEWFIRYFSSKESLSLFTSEQDPRVPAGSESYCPQCLAGDISGDEVSIQGKNAFQDLYCPDCEFEWREVYSLSDAMLTSDEVEQLEDDE